VLLTFSQFPRNQVVDHLATLDNSSQNVRTMIPMQVLLDVDNAKNPMLLTKDRLERAATENQFMNGKITAIEVSLSLSSRILTRSLTSLQSYRSYLNEALVQSFPELAPHLTSHDMTEAKLESTLDAS